MTQPQPTLAFDVLISQSLSKNLKIYTDDYEEVKERLTPEDNFNGYIDTSNTDWKQLYKNSHYTPLELIKMFKTYLEQDLLRMGNTIDRNKYRHLIHECDSWVNDELVIMEN